MNPPPQSSPSILTLNGGSSSIKFALFTSTAPQTRILAGQIERIGTPDAKITASSKNDTPPDTRPLPATTFNQAAAQLLTYLQERLGPHTITGIGHRIVHGGVNLIDHQLLTENILAELRRAQPLDLAHLPRELALIDTFRAAFSTVPQVACFDSAFFKNLPHVAQLLPIPRQYFNAGIRRLGFHGLSYTYLIDRLREIAGPPAADGRIILAHLGSGASMAAVHHGQPIDTTMAFTPTSGLVMGTRPGDLDPGLLLYLMKDQKLSPDAMSTFIAQQCGLLGVSETTSDMRDLLSRRATDPRAQDAFALFCYQAKKHLGALLTTMGGLDTLIFSGGIGEHCPEVRAAICENLDCLGLIIDPHQNAAGHDLISANHSRVTVRVIPTDEEFVIAKTVLSFVAPSS